MTVHGKVRYLHLLPKQREIDMNEDTFLRIMSVSIIIPLVVILWIMIFIIIREIIRGKI